MVATTANIDKTTRTAREMVEAQRDSYEALAENFAGVAQRRSIGLANDGLAVHEAAGGQRQGGPGMVRQRLEVAPASAAQRRVRARLDGRCR